MKTKLWIIGWLTITASALIAIAAFVYRVDPFFHYHKPLTDVYYYSLNNQRSQNDGISKHFEYDALITGTSMTENFKTSEFDELFGAKSVKVSYSGGSYKEINDNLIIALKNNRSLKTIVRGLDIGYFFDSPDRMRGDLGGYPEYLYDDNPFNDVNYIYNKDVIFSRAYAMVKAADAEDFTPGITPFDYYSSWHSYFTFGIHAVLPEGIAYSGQGIPVHLSEDEKAVIDDHITLNVTSLADMYPETDFYYFFTPYSIAFYKGLVEDGTIYRQLEAEQYIIELILSHKNIKLFSFSNIEGIITDLNNYKDPYHYAAWINSYILRCMRNNSNRITKENYLEYIAEESERIFNYDYNSLNAQIDYPNDLYAAALLNESIWEAAPIEVLNEDNTIELFNAEPVNNQHDNSRGLRCTAALPRNNDSNINVDDCACDPEYIGAKIEIQDIGKHNYLVFYGRKESDNAQPSVFVLDDSGNKAGEAIANYNDPDAEWHQFIIDLSGTEGDITVYFNCDAIENTDNSESAYTFSNIVLY